MTEITTYSVLKIPDKDKYVRRRKTLQENLAECYDKKLFTDAEIRVQSNVFRVHKCILAFYSPIFQKAFYGTKIPSTVCILNDVNAAGFDILLRFIYSSEISAQTDGKSAVHAIVAAEILQMNGIKEKLMRSIFEKPKLRKKSIVEKKFWHLLKEGHLQKITDLEEDLLKFAEKNVTFVLNHEDFSKTEAEVIKLVLSLKTLSISHDEILERIAYWKNSNLNLEYLEQSVRNLLSCVSFELLSPKKFYSIVSKYDNLVPGRYALDILMHLVDPTAAPLPKWCFSDDVSNATADASWNIEASNLQDWRKRDNIMVNDASEHNKILNNESWVKGSKFKSLEDLHQTGSLKLVSKNGRMLSSQSQENLVLSEKLVNLKDWSQVDISTKSYGKTLPESFYQMMKEGLFTDIHLVDSSGTKIPAHRLILALGSEVFANLFYGPTPLKTLRLEETADELKTMLRYFYGNGEKFSSKTVHEQLDSILKKMDLALKYECDSLVKACSDILSLTPLNPSIFWKLLNQEKQLDMCRINTKLLMTYALSGPKHIFSDKAFFKADKSFLITLLERDCINMSECEILEYVAHWLEENSADYCTYPSRKELLKFIRFEALNTEQFFTFLKLHDSLLEKEDAFAILTFLYRECKENCLPEWCYRGPPRRFFYDASLKIGTVVPIPWMVSGVNGRNYFRCTYTATLSSPLTESHIQYLEMSWKVRPNKKGLHMSHKCDITVKFDDCEPLIFKDVDVPQYHRLIVPVFFTLNQQKPKIQFDIVVKTQAYYRYRFVKQKKFIFDNVVLETNSKTSCICDAIVDNITSEHAYIPKNVQPQNHDAVIPTEKCLNLIQKM